MHKAIVTLSLIFGFAPLLGFAKNKPKMVWIPAGHFMMGGDSHHAKRDEFPKHKVMLDGFWMDKTEVTNAQFQQFVKATRYVTTAEKAVDWNALKKQLPPGTAKPPAAKLAPGALVFNQPKQKPKTKDLRHWWVWTPGASWRHPQGPSTSIKDKNNYPVVQVSWSDAKAYCEWAGKSLPTEAQWEWAARGGLKNKSHPWGNEVPEHGKPKANTWHGEFPITNIAKDGHLGLAPVESYPPNKYGLYDMSGNVWEWVKDYYSNQYYRMTDHQSGIQNPLGPKLAFNTQHHNPKKRVLRGGSFLCNQNYCTGYRVSARMRTTADSSTNHIGFRCVRNQKNTR
jgi:formylglycine-generating enzyme